MSKDLYVKHLSQQTTEEDIRTLFAVAGKVTYIHMVVDPKTEQFLGCAYVKMSSEAEAREAINSLNDARYMNSYISVTVALPRNEAGQNKAAAKRPPRPAATHLDSKKEQKIIARGDWTAAAPPRKKSRPPRSTSPKKGTPTKRGK